jgi:S-adenosylmethionine:tRNA ribosyltransferase-isomerase
MSLGQTTDLLNRAPMKTFEFDYQLPPERIAAHPASPRDASRLLVVGDSLDDRYFRDLPDLLRTGDILVANNTKVIPARLTGHRGSVKIEVTLHKRDVSEAGVFWRAFARPAKRLKPGNEIIFAPEFSATVTEKRDGGEICLHFDMDETVLTEKLTAHGVMPLPPYIPRTSGPDADDISDYQTVFAQLPGAVAAPTAGLHFSNELLTELEARSIERVELTLHVGAGTFLPVKAENVEDHKMHSEWGQISEDTADQINRARAAGGRVVAIGTTALRLLETAADEGGRIRPFEGDTDIFIVPGHKFRGVDMLLTNFHLPRSTLLMLVAAFAGRGKILDAYAHAIAAEYRFYSYGDCCLLGLAT